MTTKRVSTGITKFDFDDRKGYMVRLFRNGKQINEFFSAVRCGGMRKARKAADERYAQLLDEYGPARPGTKNKLTPRNSTGKVGVHVAHSIDNRYADCEYWAYCASWVNPDGSRRKLSFFWNKYGEEAAWEMACIARDRMSTDRQAIIELYSKRSAAKRRKK